MLQKNFWRGEAKTTKGREDRLRGNPEAPPMHDGPGEFDADMPDGADAPEKGKSQPRSKGNPPNDELPLMSQKKKLKQVLRAHALRMSANGTSTAAIGGGAGSAAGGASE